jgi:hypothetical protein
MFLIFSAMRPFQRSSRVCDVADHSLSLCQKYSALIQSCNLRLKFIYAVAQHAIAIAFLFRAALIQRVLGLTRVAIRNEPEASAKLAAVVLTALDSPGHPSACWWGPTVPPP